MCGFVNQATDRGVGRHEAVKLLADRIGDLVPQLDLDVAKIAFGFFIRGFFPPVLAIESSRLADRGFGGKLKSSHQQTDRLFTFEPFMR